MMGLRQRSVHLACTDFYWTDVFFLAIMCNMLSGFKIFASDTCWRKILADLGAIVVEDPIMADANLDDSQIHGPISPIELKSRIIAATDTTKVMNKIFGRPVKLSAIQEQIICRLYKTGGMSADELKMAMGYAKDAATHTIDTTIYELRKLFGREFIQNQNGKFVIGGI